MKRLSNWISTRQTCGQRSSMSGESKHRALALYFCLRIGPMLLISKCEGKLDLGLCINSILANMLPLRTGKFRQILRPNTFVNRKSPPHSSILLASTKDVHTPRSESPLHGDNGIIYHMHIKQLNARARRLLPADMLECWPQVCRVKITFTILTVVSVLGKKI